jgi:hypothetical protein
MPSGPAGLLLMLGLGRTLDPALVTERDSDAVGGGGVDSAIESESKVDGRRLVVNFQDAVRGQPAIETLPRRRWIRHRVRPRERVTQIAARYGVLTEELIEWNELDPQEELPPRRLRSLRVRTDRRVPGRFKVYYQPSEGEGWGDIAAKFRVEQPDIRAWNWRFRRPRGDEPVMIWVDPGVPWTLDEGHGPVVPESFDVDPGGVSVGRPNRGKLKDGVQLPESPLYTRGYPGSLYGSSHTIEVLLQALAEFRHDTGYEGEIVVGAISRRRGRRFSPHISHQSGRDIDIRLPLWPGIPSHINPNEDEVDWYATWGLVRAFVETGEVSIIFLDAPLQRRLYEAARVMGESHESLREVITWPSWKNKERPLVRHSKGHDGHIHVRIKCAGKDVEPKCK